jgi:Flp pilus assembly protein CpaB
MSNTFTSRVSGRMSSRSWAIALGIGAIVLAAILLVVYLDRYRSRVSGENAPVLVAKQLIPKGTPGSLVASQSMYAPTTLPRKEVLVGAIADPSYLAGRAAAVDIFPGSQLTATAFSASDTQFVKSQITGDERAISVSVDNVRGSLSQLQAGDTIDVYVGATGVVKLFRPNVKVLAVPTAAGGNLILKVNQKDAADFAYAADNTQLWFVIRPVVGAKPTQPDTATAASVLR